MRILIILLLLCWPLTKLVIVLHYYARDGTQQNIFRGGPDYFAGDWTSLLGTQDSKRRNTHSSNIIKIPAHQQQWSIVIVRHFSAHYYYEYLLLFHPQSSQLIHSCSSSMIYYYHHKTHYDHIKRQRDRLIYYEY